MFQSAYVYVVYYLDVDDKPENILRETHPVVCTSLRRAAMFVKPRIEQSELREINKGTLWRHGNYWIERCHVIDSFDHGLEWEVEDGHGHRESGKLPLKFGKPANDHQR
jgi:hypothetical protein